MFEATARFASTRELARFSRRWGFELWAGVDRQYTWVGGRSLSRNAGVLADTVAELVINPVFPLDRYHAVAAVIDQEEAERLDDPVTLAKDLGDSTLRVEGAGSGRRHLEPSETVRYARRLMSPSGAVLVCGGPLPDAALERFRSWPAGRRGIRRRAVKSKPSPQTIIEEVDCSAAYVCLTGPVVPVGLASAAEMIAWWMGGGISSLLVSRLRHELSLVWDVCCASRLLREGAHIRIFFACDPIRVQDCLEEIAQIIRCLPSEVQENTEEFIDSWLLGLTLRLEDDRELAEWLLSRLVLWRPQTPLPDFYATTGSTQTAAAAAVLSNPGDYSLAAVLPPSAPVPSWPPRARQP